MPLTLVGLDVREGSSSFPLASGAPDVLTGVPVCASPVLLMSSALLVLVVTTGTAPPALLPPGASVVGFRSS